VSFARQEVEGFKCRNCGATVMTRLSADAEKKERERMKRAVLFCWRGRRWIGIAVSPTACKLMSKRLRTLGARDFSHPKIA